MSKQSDFIDKVAPVIQRIGRERGYRYVSPVIGQCILESGWGETELAKHHNYFGMKTGGKWTGATVTMQTSEELKNGKIVKVNAVFRSYPDMESGIRGYYDFINTPRYQNLKDSVSPLDYIQKIKSDGYATDSRYVDKVYRIIQTYDLTRYDDGEIRETDPDENIPGDLSYAVDIFCNYILSGLLGDGQERKDRIIKIIQRRVNERLKNG